MVANEMHYAVAIKSMYKLFIINKFDMYNGFPLNQTEQKYDENMENKIKLKINKFLNVLFSRQDPTV